MSELEKSQENLEEKFNALLNEILTDQDIEDMIKIEEQNIPKSSKAPRLKEDMEKEKFEMDRIGEILKDKLMEYSKAGILKMKPIRALEKKEQKIQQIISKHVY